jgi:hypothetical protein
VKIFIASNANRLTESQSEEKTKQNNNVLLLLFKKKKKKNLVISGWGTLLFLGKFKSNTPNDKRKTFCWRVTRHYSRSVVAVTRVLARKTKKRHRKLAARVLCRLARYAQKFHRRQCASCRRRAVGTHVVYIHLMSRRFVERFFDRFVYKRFCRRSHFTISVYYDV